MKAAVEVIAASHDRARHGAEWARSEMEAAQRIAKNLRVLGAPQVACDELLSRVSAAMRALDRVEKEIGR